MARKNENSFYLHNRRCVRWFRNVEDVEIRFGFDSIQLRARDARVLAGVFVLDIENLNRRFRVRPGASHLIHPKR